MSQLNLYTVLKRGQLHPNFCEDAVFVKPINQEWLLAMVADGCSSAKESYFAATLWKKIWAKIVKILPYRHYQDAIFDMDSLSTDKFSKYLMKWFWGEVKQFKNDYYLDTNELASTLLVALYNTNSKELCLVVSGDGVYAINDQVYTINQDDKPNYLAYHLDKKFEDWWSNEIVYSNYLNVNDFAISTDGILSFAKDYKYDNSGIDISNYLLVDNTYIEQANMLERKVIALFDQHLLVPNDDLGIIRVSP